MMILKRVFKGNRWNLKMHDEIVKEAQEEKEHLCKVCLDLGQSVDEKVASELKAKLQVCICS